ncbi:hypothetical protein [Pseudomonas synxantha]|nr:hypothetical protein [Pseudomonas synxantha]
MKNYMINFMEAIGREFEAYLFLLEQELIAGLQYEVTTGETERAE